MRDIEIESESNLKVTDFLDLTLNLNTMEYRPYMKPNNKPRYITCQINHPPMVIKNSMPVMIAQGISTNSSSKKIFDEEIAQYKNALTESGYTSQIQYKEPVEDIQ